EGGRQAVVAGGEAGELVVTDHRDRAREVALRRAVERCDHGSERREKFGRQRERRDDREGQQDREREEQDLRERLIGALAAQDDLESEDDGTEDRQGDDRREEKRKRQSGAEAETRRSGGSLVVGA